MLVTIAFFSFTYIADTLKVEKLMDVRSKIVIFGRIISHLT